MNASCMNDSHSQPMPRLPPPRHGGIEILRLMAVFFILAFHSNFYALGAPGCADFRAEPILSFLKTFAGFSTLVCVDVFVLISGWFGIHPKAKRLGGLWFQCAFFCILLYVFGIAIGVPTGGKREVLKNLLWVGKWNWFIKSYVGLYLLSPILNVFSETASKRVFARVAMTFFAFQTAFWLSPMSHHDFIQSGFSTFSFMGLYLLARYVRIHRPRFAVQVRATDAVVFLGIVLFESAAFTMGRFFRMPKIDWLAYSSPFVIASSLSLLLFFTKLKLKSSFVNAVAQSSYAPYLLQTHPSIAAPLFYPLVAFAAGKPLANHWLSRQGQIWLIPPDAGGWPMPTIAHFAFVLGVLLLFFIAALLLDRIRINLWTAILSSSKAILRHIPHLRDIIA